MHSQVVLSIVHQWKVEVEVAVEGEVQVQVGVGVGVGVWEVKWGGWSGCYDMCFADQDRRISCL